MVRIITDSAADLSPALIQSLQVEVMPIKVTFGNTEYLDGVDLTHEKFIDMLIQSEELPHTSQIPPYEYEQKFKEVREAGDSAVIITLSSKLSGTYQSACIAAQKYEGTIYVVDSINATVGQLNLVQYACGLRDQGMDAAAIAAQVEVKKEDVRLVAIVDTLLYLKKGGRVSPTVALVGNLLSIKPVLRIREGEIGLLGQARGTKNVSNKMNEMIVKEGAIDETLPHCIGYCGNDTAPLVRYLKDSETFMEGKLSGYAVNSIGCTIGTHVGPGTIIVSYFEKTLAR